MFYLSVPGNFLFLAEKPFFLPDGTYDKQWYNKNRIPFYAAASCVTCGIVYANEKTA